LQFQADSSKWQRHKVVKKLDNDSQPIKMAANGRLSIPAKQRKALGLENGGMVVSTLENGELRIRTVKAVLDELRERLAPYLRASGDTVDQFIADRHAEADREEAEYQEWKAGRR
jgi:bifunctional DNA-binding transcriptional regulator/antitoxin component of YhaV-PrlF toxin-antitoxin module